MLDNREILNKVLNITNEDTTFLDIVELTKRAIPTSQPEYHHFVNEELYTLATVATGAVAATSVDVVIDATAYAAVRPGHIVMCNNGDIGFVYSKNGSNTITVKSVDGANITIATSDVISFFSNAAGEGSGAPEASRWSKTKKVNQVQIFKESYKVTDIQKLSQVEVEFKGQPYYMLFAQHESLMKFRSDIEFALWFSRKSTTKFSDTSPSLVDASGNAIQTTGGINETIEDNGINHTLDVSTIVDLDDLKEMTELMDASRCPSDYFLFVGSTMNILYDNLFKGLNTSAAATSPLSTAAKWDAGKNIDLGIESFRLYGRTFHKKPLALLNHQKAINYTGAPNFSDCAYFIPSGQIKTADGEMVDRLRVRYMTDGKTDSRYRELLLGGYAPTPTSADSHLQVVYESIQGLELLGANQCVKQKPS